MDVINQQNSFVGCKCWQSSMPLKQPERFEPESQLLASCSPRTHKPAFTALLIASHVYLNLWDTPRLGCTSFSQFDCHSKGSSLWWMPLLQWPGSQHLLRFSHPATFPCHHQKELSKNIKASKLWPDLFAKSSCSCFSTGAFNKRGEKSEK